MFRQPMHLVVLLFAAALFVGCGGSDAPSLVGVTGTVTHKDSPLAGATVTFSIEGSPLVSGITDAEGKYSLTTGGNPGSPTGDAKVTISKSASTGADMQSMKPEDMAKMAQQSGDASNVVDTKSEIPTKYADLDNSGLTATVTDDATKNVFDFALTD